MKADKLVRERIAKELEFISVTAMSSGIQATTQQRWDRIYPFLKQLGWKYRKGGLDGFLYQQPGSPQWLSCEAAATLFSKSLPEGATLVYEYSRRGVTRGKTLASTPTAAASTGVAKDHDVVPSSRPKKLLGQGKPHAMVIPGTQDDPFVHGKNAQCQGEELVSSGLTSGKVISSRSGILKRGFKSSKLPNATIAAAQALEQPFAEHEALQGMRPILYDPGVWKLQEKTFEVLDPLPGPPTYADEETQLHDEPVKDNLCRRNPQRKGRPNDKLVQEQLACGSDEDFSSDSASPVPSDEGDADTDDSSPLRTKAWTVFTTPDFTLSISLTPSVTIYRAMLELMILTKNHYTTEHRLCKVTLDRPWINYSLHRPRIYFQHLVSVLRS